jgi:hypothetical protein
LPDMVTDSGPTVSETGENSGDIVAH